MENGTYRLEASSLAVDVPSGFKIISVLIEQATSLGPYWTNLSKRIAVFPVEDLRILDDKLTAGWQIEGPGGVEPMDLMQTETVYRGNVASAFRVKPAGFEPWNVDFLPTFPVDPLGFAALRFAFHPGDAKGKFASILGVVINDEVKMMDLLRGDFHLDLDRKDWQVLELPLETFDLKGPIESISFLGNLEGTFYLDDIRLVAVTPPPSTTAVTEDYTATLPQSFTLEQNYPNPFNSETVIRFSLPSSADVELIVFNLAGQQVATLVQGAQEAGTYAVTWNGQDDDGRKLASGVYLYRLTARDGKQVATRKLLLIR